MKKIQIVGYGGAGKTTLAKKLASIFKIKHYEPDAIFWLPSWQAKEKYQFKTEMQEVVNQDSWIVCGSYLGVLNGLISKKADTIIVLNYPFRIIFWRSLKRTILRGIAREKLWGTNREITSYLIFKPHKTHTGVVTSKFRRNGRYYYRNKLISLGYENKIIAIDSPKELKEWLAKQ